MSIFDIELVDGKEKSRNEFRPSERSTSDMEISFSASSGLDCCSEDHRFPADGNSSSIESLCVSNPSSNTKFVTVGSAMVPSLSQAKTPNIKSAKNNSLVGFIVNKRPGPDLVAITLSKF